MLFLENYHLKSEYGTRQIGDDVDVDRFVKIRGPLKRDVAEATPVLFPWITVAQVASSTNGFASPGTG